MPRIDTPEIWWLLVDAHWKNLLDIFELCHAPMGRSEKDHWWRDGVGMEEVRHDKCMVDYLEDAKQDRDHVTLVKYFNLTWLAAPDQPYIHSWPSWSVLCDLCSEAWVFDPPEA